MSQMAIKNTHVTTRLDYVKKALILVILFSSFSRQMPKTTFISLPRTIQGHRDLKRREGELTRVLIVEPQNPKKGPKPKHVKLSHHCAPICQQFLFHLTYGRLAHSHPTHCQIWQEHHCWLTTLLKSFNVFSPQNSCIIKEALQNIPLYFLVIPHVIIKGKLVILGSHHKHTHTWVQPQ